MGLLNEMLDSEENQTLNERPYSRTRSAIDSTKGKVKGVFGSGQVEQGAQQTGEQANRLWSDFKRYVGRKYGMHPKSVSFEDVSAFFKGNNLDTSFLGTNARRTFSPKDVGQALLAAAREMNDEFADQQGDEESSEPSSPQSKPNRPAPQQEEKPSDEPQQEEPARNAPDNALQTKLSSLSSAERAKLIKLIS